MSRTYYWNRCNKCGTPKNMHLRNLISYAFRGTNMVWGVYRNLKKEKMELRYVCCITDVLDEENYEVFGYRSFREVRITLKYLLGKH